MAEYGLAVLCAGGGVAIRLLLDPYVGSSVPYVTFFVTNAIVIALTRTGPSLVAILLSTFAADYLFNPPQYTLWSTPGQLIASALFVAGNLVILGLARTMRKSAERAGAERALLDAVVRGANKAHLAYLDRALKVIWASDSFAGNCGYDVGDIVGKNLFSLFPNAEAEAVFKKVLSTGEPVDFQDYRFEFPNQPERGATYWDWTLTPVKDVESRVTGLVLSLFDMTQHKKADLSLKASEEALREAEYRYRMAQHSANVGSWDWHILEGTLHWSEQIEPMFGFAPGQFGRTFEAFLQSVYPQDRQLVVDSVNAAVKGEGRYSIEHRIVRPDGTIRWLHEAGEVLRRPDGTAYRMFGIVQDITARKGAELALRESEQRFRRLVEVSAQIVWVMRPDGQPAEDSPSWREFTGHTYEQWTANWLEVVHPEDRERLSAAWRAALEARSTYEIEFRMLHRSGEYRHMVARAVPLVGEDGSVREWIGMNTDITARKSAEDALRRNMANLEATVQERTAELQGLVQELEHLSYTLTHDLRSPLRTMAGFAQLVEQESCRDCSFRDYLQRISTGAKRMDTLITDGLQYTRALRNDLQLLPVNTEKLLHDIVNSYPNLQPTQADIHIQSRMPLVLGNETGLAQCFSNLLANAVKFVAPGTKARIRVRAERRAGGMVRLWFEDNGIGIAREELGRLFALFQRATNQYGGTGIGLALVRRNVERMGGTVGVESAPGKGSRFWIELKEAATLQVQSNVATSRAAAD